MFSKKSFEFEKAANEPGWRQACSICALSTITLVSGALLLHSAASARPSLPLGKLAKKRFSGTQKKSRPCPPVVWRAHERRRGDKSEYAAPAHSPHTAKVCLYDKPGTKIAVDDLVIKVRLCRLTRSTTQHLTAERGIPEYTLWVDVRLLLSLVCVVLGYFAHFNKIPYPESRKLTYIFAVTYPPLCAVVRVLPCIARWCGEWVYIWI